MKRSLRRKVSMYRMVIDVLNENQTLWQGTPKFNEMHSELTNKMEQLAIVMEKQRAYVLGVKNARDMIRIDAIKLANQISAALTALGSDTGNLELIAQTYITESKLKKASHLELQIILDRIRNFTEEYGSDLAAYGITEDVIIEFLLKRDELVVNIMAPRKAILKRKDSGQRIQTLCDEIDVILRLKTDRLVTILRPQSESFFNEYRSARMILDYGHNTPRGGNNNITY
jgi:hypothetical protein